VVCFVENGALYTVAANLQGDIVISENGAPKKSFSGAKDKIDSTATAADGSVYYSSETSVYALRNAVSTRVTGVTTNQKMDVLVSNDHSVYAGSITGFVHKINEDGVTGTA